MAPAWRLRGTGEIDPDQPYKAGAGKATIAHAADVPWAAFTARRENTGAK